MIRDAPPLRGSAPVVLHRGDDLLAVDKPAGWLTHDDGQDGRPDVVGALGEAVGIHQRLDVGTSGVLVFSRSKTGARRMQAAFEARRVGKTYLAVVDGTPPDERGVLRSPVADRPAETRYCVRARGADWTLVEATPVTGRTHQIRVHLAGIGCPVRGDGRYGDPLDLRAPRLLLHCARVELDGQRFEAQPPAPFARYVGGDALAELRADPETTCFREVNDAGWAVDRYGDWLRIQHDEGGEHDQRMVEAGPADIVHDVDHPEDVECAPVIVPSFENFAVGG